MTQLNEYLAGKKLYGDDFNPLEIEKWYQEEKEAYAGFVKDAKTEHAYIYHELNKLHGFRYLRGTAEFKNVLGIGSAYGYEFLPVASRIRKLTIIEPSDTLQSHDLGGVKPRYIKPRVDGVLDFPDNYFDLVTCFGTLHHVSNVGFVLTEIIRVLAPHGFLLLREPIRSMGDWGESRTGLTKNERGIPRSYFDAAFRRNNVHIVNKSFCESLFASRILKRFFRVDITGLYNTGFYQRIDKIISWLFSWNIHYHPQTSIEKIGPGSVFYVVRKL